MEWSSGDDKVFRWQRVVCDAKFGGVPTGNLVMIMEFGSMGDHPKRGLAIVAMGGHAFIKPGETGTEVEHKRNAAEIGEQLMTLVDRGYDLVVTHGNGPQVGNQLLQNESSRAEVPAWSLDVLVSETAGSLGYILQQAFQNQLRRRQKSRVVVTFICQVVVDQEDPAFAKPQKPVGPFLTREVAERRRDELGWEIREGGRGWRQVVPSPEPRHVVQWRTIGDAARRGHIVIACGGGGIPVVKNGEGDLRGVEAVIDKDLTSCVLAQQIEADFLVILSDVPNVYLDYGTEQERALNALTLQEIEHYIDQDQFPAGSMGPKMLAMHRFLKNGGRRGLITSPDRLGDALEGRAGTHFIGRM